MDRLQLVILEPDERKLLDKVARGDSQTFQAVYQQWQGPVYRFAWHMSGSASTAEEVTQEAFLALFEKPAGFDPNKGTIGSYLFGITRNLLLKRMRKDLRLAGTEPLDEDAPAGDPDPWAALSHEQLVETVRAAVVSLPLPYREAVALCDLEEMSYEAA